jgi:hypothetical protein
MKPDASEATTAGDCHHRYAHSHLADELLRVFDGKRPLAPVAPSPRT